MRPDRWPAGDPEMHKAVGPYGDCDNSPTKSFIIDHREGPTGNSAFQASFGKRPAEELYDLRKDPDQLRNIANDDHFSEAKSKLRKELDEWMRQTSDPRVDGTNDAWSAYEYFGGPAPMPVSETK